MKREIELDADFARLWRGRDPFAEAARLEGEEFRRVKSRRTFRFELENRGYFAKIHHGVGWREIFKNLFQGKRPVLGAANEFRALRLLRQAGVDTMTPCAYGRTGDNPARQESFLITAELTGMVSLEDFCRDWAANPPPFRQRLGILRRLASMAGAMHRAGLNHRDCYLCHFLLDLRTAEDELPRLHVIDLHRAEIRDRVPFRYRVKDVAGLYFSAMDAGLSRRDLFRFMKIYSAATLRETLAKDARFWQAADRAARKLYCREHGRPAPAVL